MSLEIRLLYINIYFDKVQGTNIMILNVGIKHNYLIFRFTIIFYFSEIRFFFFCVISVFIVRARIEKGKDPVQNATRDDMDFWVQWLWCVA